MTTTVPAYTIGDITRPALTLDDEGRIVLFGAAADFAATYGLKALYAGLPPGTPYPPVTDFLSTPVDSNGGTNSVAEGAPANTTVGVTASATSGTGSPVTYSLTGDNSGGGFKIDANTGVVTVADPTKIDYEVSGHAYTVTVLASDGLATSSSTFTIAVTDPPPAVPVDTNAAANTVAEGAAVNTLVGITASSIVAATDSASYSLVGDTSHGGFKIDPVTGVVSVADPTKIDYETAPGHAYSITVQASDGALTSLQVFTIAVTDPPLPPPVDTNAAANSIAEGAAVNTLVGLTATAVTPATDPAPTYSLTGDTSGGGFKIDPNTGVVSVADPTKIDYETAAGHAYNVTVLATDGVTSSTSTFTIAVTDPPPSAPVDNNGAANTVAEGAAVNTLVGITASSTSATNDPAPTYSLSADSSGGGFKIDPNTGVVSVADPTKIDYEVPGHAYTITVQASDGTTTNSNSFTIAVTDPPPSAPVDSDGTTNSVAEGAAVNTLVGITASSIVPAADTVTYSLTNSANGAFKIDPNTGVVSVADPTKIDYEVPGHSYSITVQASDGVLTSAQAFTIAVTDPPLGPPVDNNAAANSVAEGAAVNTLVGLTALAATPVTDPSATYSLVGDTSGGGFKIDANTGVVSVADPTKIDYETAPGHAYTVTVQASDGVTNSTSTFTIAVTDPPPSAPVDADATANTVTEGAAVNTLVGITASSTSATNDPAATYSLVGDTSGGGFQINSTTGVVSVADPTKISYEAPGHAYTITVQASDGATTNSQVFTIAVTDVPPSAPVDNDGTANSVAEGAAVDTLVGITAHSTTAATDPAATYSLTADSSGGGFKIDPNTGVVSVADPTKIDFEVPGHAYTVTVQASDGVLTSSQVFTIAVTDPPLPTPVDTNAGTNTVAEGAAVNTLVGLTAFASTPPADPSATYSLVGDTSGGGFKIDPNTGVVSVADPTKIDYETAPGHAYTVNVQASDGVSTTSAIFTIAVTDPPPSTPVDADATANTVTEGAAVNTLVGITASSTSATDDPAATYSLVGDTSGGGFQINSTTGVVSVADPTKIDYEVPGHAYTITVQASDGATTNSQVFTIAVTDVPPSAPVDSDGTTNSVAEGAAVNTLVGITAHSTTAATDPAATYSLTADSSGGGFKIDPNTGVVTVADPTKIDFEVPGHAYTVTVQASDGVLLNSQVFTIAVTDPPLPTPVDTNAGTNTVAEGAAVNTLVGLTALAATPVTDPAPTYSLTGDTSGGGFQINSTTGVVTVADPTKIDYETAPGHDYTVTVQASDGVSTTSADFTIAVTDPPPSAPVDANAGTNTVAEAATAGTLVGITASSTVATNDPAATYSLTGDTSGGGFQINSTTGVVSVADPTKVDYESSGAGHNYTITVQASDGAATNSSNFTIAVTDVAPVANADSAVVFENRATTPSVNLLTNDTDVDAPPPPLTAVDDTQPSHGTVVVNSDGTFTYTANAGYLGADSFTYHASNGGALASNSATVTVDVQPLVWHIDNNHTGDAIQDGSAAHPFQTIAAFNTANAAAGTHPDIVFVHAGTYTEANGVHLDNGQQLVGQGAAVTYQTSASSPGGVQTITLIAADANPAHVPTINATGGDAVDLAQNNTITSIHIGNASGNGIADEGGTVGTLTVSNVDINTSGGAVHIVNGGTLNVDLSSVTSTGGTNGIALTSTSGTFHVHGGSLTGASGTEVALSSGSVNFTDDGTVGDTGGSNVSISSMTGGTQSFTGAISGHGISLSSNTGATMDFSGGMNLSTGTSNALSATGGGTLNVTGTNHLTTTTGTALNIVNTNIGSSGVTFHDISVNGATNGIVLNNTGTAAGNGGLTVTGDGATPGSGGTIQNNVQGALFTNTKGLSLSYMNFTNPDSGNGTVNNADNSTFNSAADAGINMNGVTGATLDHLNVNGNGGAGGVQTGINGINVSNLTISNSSVVGFGDAAAEGDVRIFNLSGTSNITNSTFGFVPGDTSAGENLVDIRNNIGTLTLNVTGSTFHNTRDSTNGSDGLQVTSTGTATFNLNASNDTFFNLKTGGIDTFARGTSTMNVNITDGGTAGNGNTFDPGSGAVTGRAIGLNAQDTANLNFNINHNTKIYGNGGPVLEIFSIGHAVVQGRIDNNSDIQNNGTVNFAGSPIDIDTEDDSTAVVDISGNAIKHIGQDAGITAVVQGDGGSLHSATQDLTIANNTINMTGSQDFNDGILLQAGGNSNDTTSIFANVHDNAVTLGSSNSPVAFVLENTAAGSNIYLQGFVTDPQHTWAANNNTPANSELDALDHTSGGIPAGHNGTTPGTVKIPSNPNALFSASGGVAADTPTPGETNLTQAELNKAVAAAIANWTAAGLSPDKIALLQHVTYDVADITSGWLGQSTAGHVTIDVSADGHGWYIDSTPSDNSEFGIALSSTTLLTDSTTAAAGHIDLLTVVEHEMGEQLGLSDQFAPGAAGTLMSAFLANGVRELPGSTDVAQANATAIVPAWTDHLSPGGDTTSGGDSFNFAPPSTPTNNAPAQTGAFGPAAPQATIQPAGDSFQWANPDPSHIDAGATFTVFDSSKFAPIATINPDVLTFTPVTDGFNWPAQGNTPAPDTHTPVVDTTMHDTVALILPDPHVLAATVPSIGGYIIH